VIRNFKDKETEKIFQRQRSRKLSSEIQQVALRKLRMLNRLERFTGNRKGQYSIPINVQWRICLKWEEGEA